jgi:hypothetical protein
MTSLDTARFASAFVAQLVERRPYTEMIGGLAQAPDVQWPMVELRLRILHGWKERPSPYPGDSITDPLRIKVSPQEDPGFDIGTEVLVLMQRVYSVLIRLSDPTRTATRLEPGFLRLAPCGLVRLANIEGPVRALGQPAWCDVQP